MFEWLKALVPHSTDATQVLASEFGQMLDSGRHIFDAAANTLLGGTDPAIVREDLFSLGGSTREFCGEELKVAVAPLEFTLQDG